MKPQISVPERFRQIQRQGIGDIASALLVLCDVLIQQFSHQNMEQKQDIASLMDDESYQKEMSKP